MQEEDAARRLAILRGEAPPPLEEPQPNTALPAPATQSRERDAYSSATSGRKRKRPGEDDTDFEMRIARERATAGDRAARKLVPAPTSTTTAAPLHDSRGHLTLFPEPDAHTTRSREAHPDATREAARKERELKEQHQVRLADAAGGRDGAGLTDGAGPWYASAADAAEACGGRPGGPGGLVGVPSKNVFGREDPGRGARAAARLEASDPLAVMRRGAERVRELERERRREVGEREREVRALEREERREVRRRERKRRRGEGDEDGYGRRREGDGRREGDVYERREGDEHSSRREGHGHRSRRERHASSAGDGDSSRGERRSRYDDNKFREKDRHRNKERGV